MGDRNTPVVCGVYFLFKDRALTYVGQSKDCYRRIADHRTAGRDFDLATVMPLADEFLSQVEAALIKGFQPAKNKVHNEAARAKPPVELISIPRAERPSPPSADGLGLINKAKARALASSLGLSSTVIAEGVEANLLRFVPRGGPGRGVTVALYSEVLSFLQIKQRERLSSLGFPADHLDQAQAAGGARG